MSSHLFIENIGSEEVLREGVHADDLCLVDSFSNQSRRCEVLAWRAIVRRELGADVQIDYDEYGAPKVDMPATYISVSHSKGDVAVLISDAPCAVDIEQTNRDFCKVASHYLSERELDLAKEHNLFAEIWCAKEALYKYHKVGKLDFIRDVVIREYSPQKGLLTATICNGEPIVVELSRSGELAIAIIK